MLKRLLIKNVALINHLEIEWGKGFNALTGETGAGKSITVEALLLILGERASVDLIREGQDKALVEAVFDSASERIRKLLNEQGIDLEDIELIIRREVSGDGKSRAFVNGMQVPVSFLKLLGDELVDMHGQHEHQSLLKTQSQRDFLDLFGNLLPLRSSVSEIFTQLDSQKKKREVLSAALSDQDRQLDFLKYQQKEIEVVREIIEKELELEEEQNLLSHAEKIQEIYHNFESIVSECETPLKDQLGKALSCLTDLKQFDSSLSTELEQWEEVRIKVNDVEDVLRRKFNAFEYDPERLHWLEENLLELKRLKKKYGENLVEALSSVQQRVQELERGSLSLEEIDREIQKYQKRYSEKASLLTEKRMQTAEKLGKCISKELNELGFKGAVLSISIQQGEAGAYGMDQISFLISTNPGQSLKPLKDIVSGGELSRIMLAIKTVLNAHSFVPVLIFDEIDANLGGQIAHQVALQLKELAKNHQILVITHLAQIAAYAGNHFYVEKMHDGGKTVVKVSRLIEKDRPKEIARMLSGIGDSKSAILHAKELLEAGGLACRS